MDNSYRLSTPENIELSYTPAGLGARFLATVIDSLILLASVLAVVIGGFAVTLVASSFGEAAANLALAGMILFVFVVFFGYYIFFETVWTGQTPGKRLLGLRVMRDDGLPLNFSACVTRNLIRLFDLLPGAYGFGVTAMFLNRRWKRLGDMAAGTIVIRDTPPTLPRQIRLPPLADTVSEAPSMRERLEPIEYDLVREYLLRYNSLTPAARVRIGEELARLAAERTALPRTSRDPAPYLAGVLSHHEL